MQDRKNSVLRDRAQMFSRVRAFFEEREILEVDCPILIRTASIDAYIDLISALYAGRRKFYLHSSPEYGMKRLLVSGIGDIYQFSHVFRDGECGDWHNPEFMMAEWYRVGMSFQDLIIEAVDFVRLFLGRFPLKRISYREAFQRFLGVDYLNISYRELLQCLEKYSILFRSEDCFEDKDALLHLLMSHAIEPHFQGEAFWVLEDYPASQAALSRTREKEGRMVAERFEIYFQGVELANGYHELADADEQRRRFLFANEKRKELGKEALPIDENFLKSLEEGLPDCCGVSVGFDRLMMLRHKAASVSEVIPFGWEES